MTIHRNRAQAKAIALSSDRCWIAARRLYCGFCVAVTGYFAFVATWVMMHPGA
ncbi:hypothetical protein [Terrarubrum flagellatum]|uniref:hypothetical protein n=1 Tax=Terrirubrum flagellatum TaxID=2895980 RepID=UPI00314557FD